jgi:RES domain-containing protein
MTVALWRIATEAPTYSADDMTGAGAKLSGGRWNSKGTAMLYTSENIALAILETLSYLRAGGLPFNRYLVRIDVPDNIWAARKILAVPGGWDAVPAGKASVMTGDAWCHGKRSALLVVPSVIVSDERNILINPEHPDASSVTAKTLKKWYFDPRFF